MGTLAENRRFVRDDAVKDGKIPYNKINKIASIVRVKVFPPICIRIVGEALYQSSAFADFRYRAKGCVTSRNARSEETRRGGRTLLEGNKLPGERSVPGVLLLAAATLPQLRERQAAKRLLTIVADGLAVLTDGESRTAHKRTPDSVVVLYRYAPWWSVSKPDSEYRSVERKAVK